MIVERGKTKQNLEFLISQYEREIAFEERQKNPKQENIEIFGSVIMDLQAIIDLM